MRTRIKGILASSLAALTLAVTPAVFAGAPNNNSNAGGNSGTSNAGGGNEDCPAGTTLLAKFNFSGGSYQAESGGSAITITNGSASGGTFTVNAANTTVTAVVVKVSTDAKVSQVNVKTGESGTFDNSGLTNNGGNTPAISNVKFCAGQPGRGGGTTTTTTTQTNTQTGTSTTQTQAQRGVGGGTAVSGTTPAAPQVVVPQGGVGAGAGGAANASSTAGIAGLLGSIASLGAGLFWLNRRGVTS